MTEEQEKALEEMVRENQEMGLYDLGKAGSKPQGDTVELHKVPNGTYVRVLGENDVPVDAPEIKIGDVIFFDHIDGMYSFCRNKEGQIVHLVAWAEVEIVDKGEFDAANMPKEEQANLKVSVPYKGHTGTATFDKEAEEYHGRLVDIEPDVVTFVGKTIPELVRAFHDSVDEYLDFCEAGE